MVELLWKLGRWVAPRFPEGLPGLLYLVSVCFAFWCLMIDHFVLQSNGWTWWFCIAYAAVALVWCLLTIWAWIPEDETYYQ